MSIPTDYACPTCKELDRYKYKYELTLGMSRLGYVCLDCKNVPYHHHHHKLLDESRVKDPKAKRGPSVYTAKGELAEAFKQYVKQQKETGNGLGEA